MDGIVIPYGDFFEWIPRLTELQTLSLRYSRGINVDTLWQTYNDRESPNPKLKRLLYWGISGSMDLLERKDMGKIRDLGTWWKTDVTRCSGTGMQHEKCYPLGAGAGTEARRKEWKTEYAKPLFACEVREWICDKCKNVSKNLCLPYLNPRVCELCELYYCEGCLPPERLNLPMYEAYRPPSLRRGKLVSSLGFVVSSLTIIVINRRTSIPLKSLSHK